MFYSYFSCKFYNQKQQNAKILCNHSHHAVLWHLIAIMQLLQNMTSKSIFHGIALLLHKRNTIKCRPKLDHSMYTVFLKLKKYISPLLFLYFFLGTIVCPHFQYLAQKSMLHIERLYTFYLKCVVHIHAFLQANIITVQLHLHACQFPHLQYLLI